MDLFQKAFGEKFEPHLDKDAAIKFILNILMMDKGMDRLLELIDVSQEVGCIEGEPGWELERVEENDRGLVGYSDWPRWACFRVFVDPDSYELVNPEAYYTAEDFKSFASQAVNTYLTVYAEERAKFEGLVSLIERL
jgi:hypothetical protein